MCTLVCHRYKLSKIESINQFITGHVFSITITKIVQCTEFALCSAYCSIALFTHVCMVVVATLFVVVVAWLI